MLLVCPAEAITCTIKGKVINRNSKTLLICRYTEDLRFHAKEIPIVNNAFEYTFETDIIEAYHLVFKEEQEEGFFRSIIFFPSKEPLLFELFSQEEEKYYTIKSTDSSNQGLMILNDQKLAIGKKIDGFYEELDQLADEGKGDSEQALAIDKELKSLEQEIAALSHTYMEKHNNPLSYHLLFRTARKLRSQPEKIEAIYPLFDKYQRTAPSHPTIKLIQQRLESTQKIQTGKPYLDFTAQT